MSAAGWSDFVEAASALCWHDMVDAELAIAVHVLTLLDWGPLGAFRACHSLTAQAFELWTSQAGASAELSWVRVPKARQADCLRFLGQHYRNSRQVAISESARFTERLLLRLVCGMRLLETLEVDASPFGGGFPDPQRLFDRLARYCPRLQHLSISFRHEASSERQTLEVRALAGLGRRLLTLDLGAVAVRIAGGSRTLAACCPQLEHLSAQLCQQHEQPLDAVNPIDLAMGCSRLQDLDLAPVDWDDSTLARFLAEAPRLQSFALRHVVPHASGSFLAPLLAEVRGAGASRLAALHLALHARSDPERAMSWLGLVSKFRGLRSLCLDYAAPLHLESIMNSLSGGDSGRPTEESCCASLVALTLHGCHGTDGPALRRVVAACPRLQQLRVFPDSWREVGEVTDEALGDALRALPQLRSLAISSRERLCLSGVTAGARLRSASVFAPLGDRACAALSMWPCLRHLWLGPHKLMQAGVAFESCVSDAGLALVAAACPGLHDLTVASRLSTDAGAAAILRGCRELRRLRLGGDGVTDATLQLLHSLAQPRLERLALWYSGVSAAGLRWASEAMCWTYFDIELADAS